jgi:Ca-activated chloride channel homolog
LVVVPTKVTDRENKSLIDLKKEDFQLWENGVEQEIAGFEDAFAPFTIALMLDASDSTRFKLADIKAAAAEFLRELRQRDRVMIFTFDKNLRKIADGTAENLKSLQDSIVFTRAGGGTSLYDAVEAVIGEHLRPVSGKKALIVFTDGVDTASRRADFTNSLRLAQEAGVLTFPIQYPTLPDVEKSFGGSVQLVTAKGERLSVAYNRGSQYLKLLADNTGGDFYFADTLENLSKTFAKIARQLSQIYNLSYYPDDPQTANAKRRKIKVAVKRPEAVVQTRKTYTLKQN